MTLTPAQLKALSGKLSFKHIKTRRTTNGQTLSYAGLAISLWPNLIPPDVTIWQAASPPETQVFLLVGMAFLIPTILVYTAYSYWVFRGKVSQDSIGYH